MKARKILLMLLLSSCFACDACEGKKDASSDSSDAAVDKKAPQDRTDAHPNSPNTKQADAAKATPEAPLGQLTRRPTSQDPQKGTFSVSAALAGLEDSFNAKRQRIQATIKTSMGDLSCTLMPDKAPLTVANFVGLARGTRPWWDARSAKWVTQRYYQGTTFHRVIPGFMIQGGDYLGDGSGGVGYEIPDEVSPDLNHDTAGLLCMANRGPNTNGGQFFITDAAAPHLDGGYTIFGQCTPTSLVSKIAQVPQEGGPTNRPTTPVVIRDIEIEVLSTRAPAKASPAKTAKKADKSGTQKPEAKPE